MWQHVQWKGTEEDGKKFKRIAIDEMEHAEKIAKHLWYLGKKPPTQLSPIIVGETPTEMLTLDMKAEEGAVKMYEEIIQAAEKEGDAPTKEMFERIQAQEKEHRDFFTSLLEK
jgi:bacterioferritin